jgi:hypothetical protein
MVVRRPFDYHRRDISTLNPRNCSEKQVFGLWAKPTLAINWAEAGRIWWLFLTRHSRNQVLVTDDCKL